MSKAETNYMYVELDELPFDSDEEVAKLRAALDNINTPFEGRAFEDIYAAAERHVQDVLGLQAKYERYMEDVLTREKRKRSQLEIELSQAKNPATGKPYTLPAIAALIEQDAKDPKDDKDLATDHLVGIVDLKLSCKSIINYLRKLYTLHELHYSRIENVNINARRAWQAQT